MNKQFYTIIGKSGSGKGTQAKLLKEYLHERGYQDVRHITTGGEIRNFITNNNSHSRDLAQSMVNKGELLPEFFAVWNWVNVFINNIGKDTTIILDGAPRALSEAKMMDGAVRFYGYDNMTIIYIDVSDAWARRQLLSRGRADDSDDEKVNNKLNWFARDVLPVIDWYKNYKNNVKFYHINGEQSIEEVSDDIVKSIKMYGDSI